MEDDWGMDPWYGRRENSYDGISLEQMHKLVSSVGLNEKEELRMRIKELELEVYRLREKAKKKEKEFKEFRKLRKAIKADSVNTKMARLVKRI